MNSPTPQMMRGTPAGMHRKIWVISFRLLADPVPRPIGIELRLPQGVRGAMSTKPGPGQRRSAVNRGKPGPQVDAPISP